MGGDLQPLPPATARAELAAPQPLQAAVRPIDSARCALCDAKLRATALRYRVLSPSAGRAKTGFGVAKGLESAASAGIGWLLL
jgi:hypothetical protein